MRVSIITVCYNRVETIERAIRSVSKQGYEDMEYIIIDGGSTDGTVDIIKKYERDIAYWVSEKDDGIYEAMNKGLSHATGEIVAFLNSDDWYEENIISKIAQRFEDKKVRILCGDVYCHHNGTISRYCVNKEIEEEIRFRMIYWQPAMFVRRELFELYGGFDTRYQIAADYDWMLRIYDRHVVISLIDMVMTNFSYGGISTQADMFLIQAEEGRQAALTALCRNRVLTEEEKVSWHKIIEEEYNRGVDNYKFKKWLKDITLDGNNKKALTRAGHAFQYDQYEVFGCGMIFEEISNILKRLCISVVALWDSDPGKWGTRMEGIEIGNPDRMRPGQNTVIIASANYEREIGELLEEKGFKKDEDYIPYSELRRRILYFVEENGFD